MLFALIARVKALCSVKPHPVSRPHVLIGISFPPASYIPAQLPIIQLLRQLCAATTLLLFPLQLQQPEFIAQATDDIILLL